MAYKIEIVTRNYEVLEISGEILLSGEIMQIWFLLYDNDSFSL